VLIGGPKFYGDGAFAQLETPEARGHLQQMCEGRVIARICWDLNTDLPDGAAGFGLEFAGSGPVGRNYRDLGTGGERLIIMALPVTSGPWLARLIWRWIPAQQLWTRDMRRHFGTDRAAAGEPEPDFLQRQIEGQMIRGVYAPSGHVGLGERIDFELTDASVVIVESIPQAVFDPYTGRPTVCDLDVRREDRRQRVITTGGVK
jgi:hypothetical protein